MMSHWLLLPADLQLAVLRQTLPYPLETIRAVSQLWPTLVDEVLRAVGMRIQEHHVETRSSQTVA